MNILVHFSRALAPGRPYRGRLSARPETGLERLRRSRVIPLLALAVLLGPLVPRTARADGPPPPSPPTGLSIQGGQASLGAAESSPSAASSLAVASVNPSTGVLHTSIAFDLPKARGGVQPQLALTYSSSAPFGVGGRGWSLGIPSVERHNPSGPPQFNDPAPGQAVNPAAQDRFTFGGQPLVEVCFIASGGTCTYGGSNETLKGQNLLLPGEQLPSFATPGGWHYYRFQTETGALTRFFWSADHMTWVVQDKSGTISEYGWSQDHTTAATDNDGYGDIFRWNVVKRYDAERISGSAPANLISYVWTAMTPTLGGTLGYLTDIYDTPRVGDAAPATDSFAHHTHLAYTATPWATGPIWNPSVTAPVWFALPTFVLTRVDVASQDYAATGARQQVRRYHLTYNSAASDSIESPPTIAPFSSRAIVPARVARAKHFPTTSKLMGNCPPRPPRTAAPRGPQRRSRTLRRSPTNRRPSPCRPCRARHRARPSSTSTTMVSPISSTSRRLPQSSGSIRRWLRTPSFSNLLRSELATFSTWPISTSLLRARRTRRARSSSTDASTCCGRYRRSVFGRYIHRSDNGTAVLFRLECSVRPRKHFPEQWHMDPHPLAQRNIQPAVGLPGLVLSRRRRGLQPERDVSLANQRRGNPDC